jgi:hypothetical protein
VADVLGHRSIVVSQAALPILESRCAAVTRTGQTETGDDEGGG